MMRVFVLSNDDLTSHLIFSSLFDSKRIEVAGVGFTTTLVASTTSRTGGVLAILKRVGWRYWSYLVFTNACFRLHERWARETPAGAWPRSLRALCRARNVPVVESADFGAPSFLERLRAADVDLLLIRVNQILTARTIAIPRHGTWCVHSSLLPSYRGIAAEFHSLCDGAPMLGSTIFDVEEKLDRGAPLFQCAIERRDGASVFDHMLRNNRAAGDLLRAQVEALDERGAIEPALVEHGMPSSYRTWPTPAEVRSFRRAGGRLIRLGEAAALLGRCLRRRPRGDAP